MNKIVKIAIVMAIMMSATFAFGQDPSSVSAAASTIAVTITDKGANCSVHGIVTSEWLWKSGYPQYSNVNKAGTSANYTLMPGQPPVTVTLQSISPGNYWYETLNVKLTIKPNGNFGGENSKTVNKPFNPTTLNPNPCTVDTQNPDLQQ
jgi:hypothetical protein